MKKIITTVATLALMTTSAMSESISTYLVGEANSIDSLTSKLKDNGFNVLATTNNILTITNAQLQATNTYLATLQVYVGASVTKVQNPAYFGLAYLNDNYKKGQFKSTIDSLTKALGSLKDSEEKLEADDIAGYHFMMGMPYFSDSIIVADADNIYTKVAGNQKILYSLTLPNGTLLVGHKLNPATKGFLKTLHQTTNGQILPYEALVFSNQVKIMNPKFYLALSLPKLTMGQFMKISDIPDKIEEDISNAYK